MGTRKLYDFIDDNPSFMLMDGAYVNDAAIIAQNNKMISINSCVEIDFLKASVGCKSAVPADRRILFEELPVLPAENL